MPTALPYIPIFQRPSGAGDTGKAWLWDNSTGRAVLTALNYEPAGAVATHAALTSGVHGISAFGASLVDDADAATARTTLGLGTIATEAATSYLAATGATNGATIQAQRLTNGITIANAKAIRFDTLGTAKYSVEESASGSNYLFKIGYNINLEDIAKHALYTQYESDFSGVMEWWLGSLSPPSHPSGTLNRRPIFVAYNQTTLASQVIFSGEINFKNSASAGGFFTIEDGGNFIVQGAGELRNTGNNSQWLKQKAPDGATYRSLIHLNSSDQVSVAPDGIATVFGGRLAVANLDALAMLDVRGTISPSTAAASGLNIAPTVTPTNNSDISIMEINPTVTTPDGVTTGAFRSLYYPAPLITLGAGSALTEANTIYIGGAPNAGTTRWALNIAGGNVRIVGTINPTTTTTLGGSLVTGGSVRLANNSWLLSRNAANSADVNVIRINSGNEIEIGTTLNLNFDTYMANNKFFRQAGISGNYAAMIGITTGFYEQIGTASAYINGITFLPGAAETMRITSALVNVTGTLQADGLRLDMTPVSETPTPTHTITISLDGTNYKIPCVAA